MKPKIVLASVAILAGLGWVLFRGLSGNLVYYQTPSELLAEGPRAIGQEVRLGGLVAPGSTRPSEGGVDFILTDGTTRVTVAYTGPVPALFRSGTGAVVEGRYEQDGEFHADTLLVKHSADYRPPAPGATPTAATLEGGS